MTPTDPRLQLIAAQAKVRPPHVFHLWHALRAMGKQFHAEAFAQFTGLELRHITAIIAALSEHDALPDGRAKTEQRASRLPLDWTLPDEWRDWAIELKFWTPSDTLEEAASFADYWQARSGHAATKLDWRKTWQNWVRNSRRANGTYRAPSTGMVSTREHLEKTAALYERMGRTTEAAEIRERLASNVIPLSNRLSR